VKRAGRTVSIAVIAALATSGCAHKQLTNRQVAIGAAVVVGVGLLLYLAIEQCNKGAAYCDNSPNP
jgi:hypothetical protein